MTRVSWLSKTGAHVEPPSVDFHTPPPAVATYTMLASGSTMARSVIRPPMFAGPMQRAGKPARTVGKRSSAVAKGLAKVTRRTAATERKRSMVPSGLRDELDWHGERTRRRPERKRRGCGLSEWWGKLEACPPESGQPRSDREV